MAKAVSICGRVPLLLLHLLHLGGPVLVEVITNEGTV